MFLSSHIATRSYSIYRELEGSNDFQLVSFLPLYVIANSKITYGSFWLGTNVLSAYFNKQCLPNLYFRHLKQARALLQKIEAPSSHGCDISSKKSSLTGFSVCCTFRFYQS